MTIEKWISKNIDSKHFENKNVLITGGNSGIGYELAKHVLSLGSNVILLSRNENKATEAINELSKFYPNRKISFIKLDLASLSSIEEAVENIKKCDVDMFVNNAGVFRLPKSLTKDGFEIIMGTNYIGTLYLSELLLPYLTSLKHPVHFVYESSIASNLTKINYKDFFMDKNYDSFKIYGRSKVGINNIYGHYSNMYKESNIIFSLTHPGGTYTPLINKAYTFKPFQDVAKGFMKIVFHSPKKASLTMLYALNENKNIKVGPRGVGELSGFPKKVNLYVDPHQEECISYGLDLIKTTKERA